MTQIVWIARHANRLDFVNPDWFLTAERRYDPPLSDDGMIQAQQLAKRLNHEKIKHIFASPFLRTVQTANAVAEVLNLPIKLETGFERMAESSLDDRRTSKTANSTASRIIPQN
jgi:broad specificity phosphatase PhoE